MDGFGPKSPYCNPLSYKDSIWCDHSMVTFHKKIPSWWFSRDQNGWLWQWVTHRFWDAKDWLQGRVSKMGVARDQDSKSFYGLFVPGSFYWSIFDIQAGWWFQTFFMFHNIWDNPSHWLSYFPRWLKHVKTTNQDLYFWIVLKGKLFPWLSADCLLPPRFGCFLVTLVRWIPWNPSWAIA